MVKIYVEGGGRHQTTLEKCRGAFAKYCAKILSRNHGWRIVACGSRDEASKRFQIAIKNCAVGDIFALLVDAEAPVNATTAIEHLRLNDGWILPLASKHSAFLMVQAMEAWFLADRETLTSFYGDGFLAKSLPGSATGIEAILKKDLASSLSHAAKPTTKGEYHKTRHGFALLALIDPQKVEKASPHAASFHQFL